MFPKFPTVEPVQNKQPIKKLTKSGKCEPIETSRPAAALCQSAFSSYIKENNQRELTKLFQGKVN